MAHPVMMESAASARKDRMYIGGSHVFHQRRKPAKYGCTPKSFSRRAWDCQFLERRIIGFSIKCGWRGGTVTNAGLSVAPACESGLPTHCSRDGTLPNPMG